MKNYSDKKSNKNTKRSESNKHLKSSNIFAENDSSSKSNSFRKISSKNKNEYNQKKLKIKEIIISSHQKDQIL